MKTPIEIEEKNTGFDAEFLRRQYFHLDRNPVGKTTDKPDSLLTPFLLSIPVIIMLIILIYSL